MNKTWITSFVLIVIFTTCGILPVNSRFGAKLGSQIKGEETLLYPLTNNLGQCEAEETREIVFDLCNLSSRDVLVDGIITSCSCTACDELPLTIKPKSNVQLKIEVRLPKYDSSFSKEITFLVEESRGMAMRKARILAKIPNPFPIPEEDASAPEDKASEESPSGDGADSDSSDVQMVGTSVGENLTDSESETENDGENAQNEER